MQNKILLMLTRLNKLFNKKIKLNQKIAKLQAKVNKINEEALSYKGKGSIGQDAIIEHLVHNKYFETPDGKFRHLRIIKK